jgi:hypothetical protein
MIVAAEIEIAKTAQEVFPWIADPEKAMQWQRNIKSGEVVNRKPGIVGTEFKETLEEGGAELEMLGRITDFVGDKLMEFHLESRVHVVDVIYKLEGIEGHTRLSVEADIEWKFPLNLVRVFLGRKMRSNLSNEMIDELNTLKRICESEYIAPSL